MYTCSVLFHTPRSAVLELHGAGAFETASPYTVLLNGLPLLTSTRVVQPLYGLTPDTDYTVRLRDDAGNETDTVSFHTEKEFVTLDVRRFGARGDGVHDDTAAMQAAIMACPPDSRVLVPAGQYRVTSLFLKSSLTLTIDAGATLLGTLDREKIPVLPGITQAQDEVGEYNLGSWEGNPLDCFAAMITGLHVENVVINGAGTLDGCASDDDWWADDRAKIIAFRPRMLFLNGCKNITMQGLTVQNSPSWTLHPYFSQNIRFLDLTLRNPWDSPNTDGIDPESVSGLEIVGVHFSLGDDCIAIKSASITWATSTRRPRAISRCVIA